MSVTFAADLKLRGHDGLVCGHEQLGDPIGYTSFPPPRGVRPPATCDHSDLLFSDAALVF